MKIFLIAGPVCAGKDTVAEAIKDAIVPGKALVLSLSTPMGEVLDIFDVPHTRKEFVQFASALKNTSYGQPIFLRAVRKKIRVAEERGVIAAIVCGARFLNDLDLVADGKGILVGVRASAETRYARALRDPEKNGAPTFEEFLENDAAPTEGEIEEILRRADVLIENEGTLDELRFKVNELVTSMFP